jgi:RNA polymerase sigma-70 factor (ECF subfamily)
MRDELLDRARRGDRSAMMQLVRRHSEPVRGFLWRMTGREAETDDLLQETLLRFVRSLPQLRPDSDVRSWLFRVASRLCVDRARVLARVRTGAGDPDPEETEPEPAALAECSELAARAFRELVRLPPKHRAAICLRLFEELSYREIADALEDSEANARWFVFQARRTMFERIKGSL